MIDWKTQNTLFDKDQREATIIDLGGTLEKEKDEDTLKIDIVKYNYHIQFTPRYTAPELYNENVYVIDLTKALSYSCRKVAAAVTLCTDYKQDNRLKDLIDGLVYFNPADRLSQAVLKA